MKKPNHQKWTKNKNHLTGDDVAVFLLKCRNRRAVSPNDITRYMDKAVKAVGGFIDRMVK